MMVFLSFFTWLEKMLLYFFGSLSLAKEPRVWSSIGHGIKVMLRPEPPSTFELVFVGVLAFMALVGCIIASFQEPSR
jgi:hypothetical protein